MVDLSETGHEWTPHHREGWAVCSRCGMVRNYERETPCRVSLPQVQLRSDLIAERDALNARVEELEAELAETRKARDSALQSLDEYARAFGAIEGALGITGDGPLMRVRDEVAWLLRENAKLRPLLAEALSFLRAISSVSVVRALSIGASDYERGLVERSRAFVRRIDESEGGDE